MGLNDDFNGETEENTMAIVRFYFDVCVDEDDVRENLGLENGDILSDEDIVDRAKTLLGDNIQDRDINVNKLEYEVLE